MRSSFIRDLGRLALVLAPLASACSDDGDSKPDEALPPATEGLGNGAGAAGTAQGGAAGSSAGAAGSSGNVSAGNGGSAQGGTGQAGQAGAAQGGAGQAGQAGNDAGGNAQGGEAQGGQGGAQAGAGGEGGSPAQGGQGGTGQGCLDASTYADLLVAEGGFTVCVKAIHKTAAVVPFLAGAPSWGSHGGPLTTRQDGPSVVLERWTAPADAQGEMQVTQHAATLPGDLPSMVFWGAAIDMPTAGLSLLPYTTSSATFSGEVLAFDSAFAQLSSRAHTNGYFAGVEIGAAPTSLVYTGLSALSPAAIDTNDNALYAAQLCDGKLAPEGPCPAATRVGSWGGASGPVTRDAQGNVFATQSEFGGEQQIRGFSTAQLTSGTASDGAILLADTDFSTSIAAAIGASGGVLLVQASSAADFMPKKAQAVRYTEAGGAIATAAPVPGTLTIKGGSPAVLASPDGTFWALAQNDTSSAFVAFTVE